MITYEYDLDVTPGGNPVCVNLSQYDQDYELKFSLYSRQGNLDIKEGTIASIRGTKNDGTGYSVDAVILENVVTVCGDQQMTAVSGKHPFEIKLELDGRELNTANFIVYVERAPLDKDTVKSVSVIKELENAEELTEKIIRNAEKTKSDIEKLAKETSDAAAEAEESALQAARSKEKSEDYSKEAESFAHGNTGIRQGENKDNSEYYYKKSKEEYERAKTEADRANLYADFVTPEFILQDNRLYMKRGGTIDFIVKDNRMYAKLA